MNKRTQTPWEGPADRLEKLDRLARSSCPHVTWKPVSQLYEVRWPRVARLPIKTASLCSKSGRMIRSNCDGMTEASIDARLGALFGGLTLLDNNVYYWKEDASQDQGSKQEDN